MLRYVRSTSSITEFTDPRLVAVYDSISSYGPGEQPQFYGQLATDLGARSIVDLGCGTGLITCDLARLGYRMTGVDPAPAMLELARRRNGGERVEWIDGDARALGARATDLAIMTGHVAQFFLTDESWATTLSALHAALSPGGCLAFETRNPAAREWERWTRESGRTVVDPHAGRIETWTEVSDVKDGIVTYANRYVFAATGEDVVAPHRLRFRSEAELHSSLAAAGFALEHLYGDWDRRPAGPTTRELIVVATR